VTRSDGGKATADHTPAAPVAALPATTAPVAMLPAPAAAAGGGGDPPAACAGTTRIPLPPARRQRSQLAMFCEYARLDIKGLPGCMAGCLPTRLGVPAATWLGCLPSNAPCQCPPAGWLHILAIGANAAGIAANEMAFGGNTYVGNTISGLTSSYVQLILTLLLKSWVSAAGRCRGGRAAGLAGIQAGVGGRAGGWAGCRRAGRQAGRPPTLASGMRRSTR
jgi:hypothetical protein